MMPLLTLLNYKMPVMRADFEAFFCRCRRLEQLCADTRIIVSIIDWPLLLINFDNLLELCTVVDSGEFLGIAVAELPVRHGDAFKIAEMLDRRTNTRFVARSWRRLRIVQYGKAINPLDVISKTIKSLRVSCTTRNAPIICE